MKSRQEFDIFHAGKLYREIRGKANNVFWRKILAGPGSQFICWLGCHGRLATKDRLLKFGVTNDGPCSLCVVTKKHLR